MNAPAKKLRVAVLNRTFSPTGGGAERYSIALVEHLANRYEIHVFAQSIDHQWPGVSYHRVSMPLRRPRWINQLWFATATWWATRTGFDVVHSHENTWHGDVQTVHVLPVKHTLFYGCQGWRRALRLVKVLTSPRLLTYLWLERVRYAGKLGRHVVVTSDTLRRIFVASYPKAMVMTSLITPGITLPKTSPNTDGQRDARQKLGLPQDRPCVLFVGNDFRKKGLSTLLEAMRLLSEDVILAVVGSSAQLPMFRKQVGLVGLASRVFFLGSLKDVGPAYRATDCLAHPTLEDTFAMVVLEAMAYGLPVVVSGAQYCGISGLLENNKNALILDDPQDVSALAESMHRVVSDEVLRKRLGQAARNFASNYEWSGIAAQQEKIYAAVIAAKAG